MQIKFKKISLKNLLSYGNVENVIDLESYKHTIITGKNGQGKSILLDAICYVLYGKAYRQITLGQLINSINKKNLLVILEFSIGMEEYRVIRGQKPNVFQIFKNDILIEESASTGDYQKYLEQKIIGINLKTFKQIVVIGSATYTPFMNLTAAERRSITEDVLDIGVFSDMQAIAKTKLAEYKSKCDTLVYEIELAKKQIDSQNEILSKLTDDQERDIKEKRDESQRAIDTNTKLINDIDSKLKDYDLIRDQITTLTTNKNKIISMNSKQENKIANLTESLGFYDSDTCPTCGQSLDEDFCHDKKQLIRDNINDITKSYNDTKKLLEDFTSKIDKLNRDMDMYRKLTSERKNAEHVLKYHTQILNNAVNTVSSETITLCKEKIRSLIVDVVNYGTMKSKYTSEMEHYKTAVELLKDTGIKAKVISKFIPVLNQYINEYLNLFDMFVSFELDETFNETIKSRNRDKFSYNSFSEGEKTKIDLSILFAWRKVALSRNSISTNLIIFDETMDSSLDEDSVCVFVSLLESIESGVNSIVISHRNMIPELFDRHINVAKTRDFSGMEVL